MPAAASSAHVSSLRVSSAHQRGQRRAVGRLQLSAAQRQGKPISPTVKVGSTGVASAICRARGKHSKHGPGLEPSASASDAGHRDAVTRYRPSLRPAPEILPRIEFGEDDVAAHVRWYMDLRVRTRYFKVTNALRACACASPCEGTGALLRLVLCASSHRGDQLGSPRMSGSCVIQGTAHLLPTSPSTHDLITIPLVTNATNRYKEIST
jgi:hypothetical protein